MESIGLHSFWLRFRSTVLVVNWLVGLGRLHCWVSTAQRKSWCLASAVLEENWMEWASESGIVHGD